MFFSFFWVKHVTGLPKFLKDYVESLGQNGILRVAFETEQEERHQWSDQRSSTHERLENITGALSRAGGNRDVDSQWHKRREKKCAFDKTFFNMNKIFVTPFSFRVESEIIIIFGNHELFARDSVPMRLFALRSNVATENPVWYWSMTVKPQSIGNVTVKRCC